MVVWKLTYVVTLCLLFGYFGRSSSAEDVPEFQYPCYVDICTFPRQFCNSDKSERRCSPCSTSLCKDGRIPLACKYHCNRIQNANSETTVPVDDKPTPSSDSEAKTRLFGIISTDLSPSAPKANVGSFAGGADQEEDSTSIYLIVAYNAVITTCFMITLMISCVWYIQKKRNDRSKDQVLRNSQQLQYQSNVRQAGDLACEPFLQGTVCPHCGATPQDDIAPPSYRTETPVVMDTTSEANGTSLVAQATELAAKRHCHPELSETDTQTTRNDAQTSPKSHDLSFDFSENVLKSRDI